MFSQLMGNYLVEKGIIDEDIKKAVLAEQAGARVRLGTIAVAEKMLTEKQAEEIIHLLTQMDLRFGDIAVDKGYLTEDQVKQLLDKQGNAYMKFIQLITEKTDLTVQVIEEHVEGFRKERGFTEAELTALKQDDIDTIVPVFAFSAKPYVTDLVGLILRNITRFVTTDFYIDRIRHVSEFEYKFISGQKVAGDHSIYLGFAADEDTDGICLLASKYAGETMTEGSDDVADAVGEFANINNGLLASELSEKGVDIDMEPPFTYINQTAEGSAYIVNVYIEGRKISLYIAVDSEISIGKLRYVYKSQKSESVVNEGNSKGTVVIVDDSRMIRKMLRGILEGAGYCVLAEAENGLEAVTAYKQYKPDIITLDITMPQMDGVEALREIIKYDPDAYAIMITAAGQQQKVISALKIGAAKFVMKPFMKEEVLNSFVK